MVEKVGTDAMPLLFRLVRRGERGGRHAEGALDEVSGGDLLVIHSVFLNVFLGESLKPVQNEDNLTCCRRTYSIAITDMDQMNHFSEWEKLRRLRIMSILRTIISERTCTFMQFLQVKFDAVSKLLLEYEILKGPTSAKPSYSSLSLASLFQAMTL
ncbi:hypothetical protein BDF20DRAFT_838972 [Mycotypha africana]|uniref:uncharacterized protein n=1 Tax=Mycotypha africana TaxID=64632 RepID=UPI002300879C|nr:uncharacterized protein BDF20DRAFT_838972 [Mycotypha africana]KAI8968997.1 hypothetical protein BDF20DRAFT_838972 [Mycotypha africana]